MSRKSVPIVALLSLSLIALELAWTRLFSAEFFYNFAYLILSLAVLGLGAGALAVRLAPWLDREGALGPLLSLTALASLGGPPLAFLIEPEMGRVFQEWAMAGRLLLTILTLGSAYFLGGMVLALVFRRGAREIPRLYRADLIGAGLGVPAIFVLMNAIGTPAATFYASVPLLLAAFLAARRFVKLVPLLLVAAMVVLGFFAEGLLERPREERAPVIHKHWDAMAKVKVYDFESGYRGLNIDNAANSPVYPFDGDWERPDREPFQFGIDVKYLMDRFESCTFLSLGAGGGVDVLQALQGGCGEVHAVEVVPYVNHLMRDGELAEYSGGIYRDPRVRVITDNARLYARRHRGAFDIIYSLSSNTFAALASGAFAMAENYLFTTGAFRDYWQALTADGFMMMEHQFYAPRLTAELMEALDSEGVAEPSAHFAVYALPSMRRQMILLSKRPLTDEIRNHAFGELTPEIEEHIHLLWPPAEGHEGNLVQRIVEEGWETVQPGTEIDISPCGDDRPYTAQLGRWSNFSFEQLESLEPLHEVRGFPLARMIVLSITAVAALILLPLNLLPYLGRRSKLRAAPWLYFFAIGMAFMMVEVVLIQKYALLVGPSVYSIAAVLLTLLLFSGIGSGLAGRISDRAAFGGILAWLLLDAFVFPLLFEPLAGLPQASRIVVAVVLIAPLGLFMGMPFPKAGLRVGSLIDWGFAVNGTASVIGSAVALLVAFDLGFRAALLLAAALYAAAFGLFAWRSAWTAKRRAGTASAVTTANAV